MARTGQFNATDPDAGPPPDLASTLGPLPVLLDYHGSHADWHGPAWGLSSGDVCPTCLRSDPDVTDRACLVVTDPRGSTRWLHRVRDASWTIVGEQPADEPAHAPSLPPGHRRWGPLTTTRTAVPFGLVRIRYIVHRIDPASRPVETDWFIDRDRYGADQDQRYRVFLAGAGEGGCAKQYDFARLLADALAQVQANLDRNPPGAFDRVDPGNNDVF
jgi:hypothetical protein